MDNLNCSNRVVVTERKQAEQATQAASQYARSLLEASLDPLVTISAEGKITDVNTATEQVTGVSRESLIGSDFADYFTDPQKARVGYQQVFLQGSVTDYPLAIRHVTGKLTDVLYNASLYRDTNGNVLGVFAAARDITERKQAEQATQAASQYARSLLEASLDPLVTISAEGKITDVNTATEQVTGVSRESLIRHVTGKLTDVLYNASLYRDTNGNVLGVFAAARDITESKRLGQALQSRNLELEAATAVAEKANLAKSNFLSSMSHELRTPLNAILGFAQLIESDVSLPTPSQKRSLDQILSAGWFLLELVNEILDLAQIESGKAVMTREAVPLEHIMSECRELVEPLAHKHGIEISFPRMERPHWVDADRTRTRQVLINLLHNAIKYNKQGGMVTMACTLVPPDKATSIL
jgi:PAS domain S-box-containing protein